METRENFGSRAAVIMAFAGSAIGLGNIWRFPYMVGEYGGAAFVLVYILCSFLLSLPIFLAESVIGRRSRANAIGSMKILAPGTGWKVLGIISILAPFVIVSYYSVVGGWAYEYFVKSFGLHFGEFIPSGWKVLIYNTIFLGISAAIVAFGVKSGIEKFSKFSIPALFVLIVLIMVYSLNMPGAERGVEYLLKPDFSKLTAKTFTFALGQSFYSLSLGMGIILTYSSYVKSSENLLTAGAGTAIADLMFAILAGFAIMPAVFASGVEPSSGPGLIFQTLPNVFISMGETSIALSSIISAIFFFVMIIAAMTSTVSLIEVLVAYLIEERHMKRRPACVVAFALIWTLGLVSVFSINAFGAIDAFSSNILLTLGAILVVLFVGWKMKREDVRDELTNGGKVNARWFPALYFAIRYLAPLAILIIFLSNFLN